MSDPMHERFKLSEKELEERRGSDQRGVDQSRFPLLEEGNVLDASDMECFSEIRNILLRYGKTEKFGITLLHKHFDLHEGETLVESTDTSTRTMTIQPEVLDPGEVGALDTQWYLGSRMPLSLVKCRTSMHK